MAQNLNILLLLLTPHQASPNQQKPKQPSHGSNNYKLPSHYWSVILYRRAGAWSVRFHRHSIPDWGWCKQRWLSCPWAHSGRQSVLSQETAPSIEWCCGSDHPAPFWKPSGLQKTQIKRSLQTNQFWVPHKRIMLNLSTQITISHPLCIN